MDNGSAKKLKKLDRARTVDDLPTASLETSLPAPIDPTLIQDTHGDARSSRFWTQPPLEMFDPTNGPDKQLEDELNMHSTPAKLLARAAQTVIIPPTFSPEDEVNLIATSPLSDLKFEPDCDTTLHSSSQNFPQPPASSLVSPPASAHTDAEQTPPAATRPKNMTPSATASSSRQSSRPAKTVQRYTPESGSPRRESTISHERGSGSPTVVGGMMTGSASVQKRTKSRMGSEIEADEESMRLIRELQAQDMGLRRRGRA